VQPRWRPWPRRSPAAFEFDFDHAYGFYSKLTGRYHDSPEKYELFADIEGADSDADSVQETAVSKAFTKAGKKMLFLFDYGDEWRFTVELVKARREEARNTLSPAGRLFGRRARAISRHGLKSSSNSDSQPYHLILRCERSEPRRMATGAVLVATLRDARCARSSG